MSRARALAKREPSSLDETGAIDNAPRQETPPIRPLSPPAHGIDLWWCELDVMPAGLEWCFAVLSGPERERAARYGNPALRERYAIGRAALRCVLGQTLELDPADVPIVRGNRGRPRLDAATDLDFNVSHTGSAALIGLIRGARIGVDIERADREINVAGIARKFLTDNERRAVIVLDDDAARRRVLALWTCKEAMSKATGDALSAPMATLDVDLADVAPTLCSGTGKYCPAQWTLQRASVPAGFIGTVAVWRQT